MALMKDFMLPPGVDLSDFFTDSGFSYVTKKEPYLANNVYIKIENIKTNTNYAELSLVIKRDKDAKNIMTKEYTFPVDLEKGAANVFEQGYEYLTSLDEFKGALSV